MRQFLDEWYARKLARRSLTIKESRTTTVEYYRNAGPRGIYAKLVLRGDPAEAFSFSCCEIPQDARCETAIVDGILDELLANDLGGAVTKLTLTVTDIGWHDVDSSPMAFYLAARQALRQILGREGFPSNVQYS